MGGSSATSPRRNIAAIIFKQAASGRSIFLSGTRRYSNRRLDRTVWAIFETTRRLLCWKCDLSPSHIPRLIPPLRTRRTFPFSLRPSRLPTFFSSLEKRVRDNSWRSREKGGIRERVHGKREKKGKREGSSRRFLRAMRRTGKKAPRLPLCPIRTRYRTSKICSSRVSGEILTNSVIIRVIGMFLSALRGERWERCFFNKFEKNREWEKAEERRMYIYAGGDMIKK